jgi:hypothetical protein
MVVQHDKWNILQSIIIIKKKGEVRKKKTGIVGKKGHTAKFQIFKYF